MAALFLLGRIDGQEPPVPAFAVDPVSVPDSKNGWVQLKNSDAVAWFQSQSNDTKSLIADYSRTGQGEIAVVEGAWAMAQVGLRDTESALKNEFWVSTDIADDSYWTDDDWHFPTLIPLLTYQAHISLNSGQIQFAVDAVIASISTMARYRDDPAIDLIDYVLVLAMQDRTMLLINRILEIENVPKDTLVPLQAALHSLNRNDSEAFSRAIANEYRLKRNQAKQLIEASIHSEMVHHYGENHEQEGVGVSGALRKFWLALASRYVAHPNRLLSETTDRFGHAIHAAANNQCTSGLDPISGDDATIWDLIKPNQLRYIVFEVSYDPYYVRRCLAHFLLDATAVNVALKLYDMDTKQLPASIQSLVPDYLPTIPLDRFSGAPLSFNRSDMQIIARGLNGSDKSVLRPKPVGTNKCRVDGPAECAKAPMFPLRYKELQKVVVDDYAAIN